MSECERAIKKSRRRPLHTKFELRIHYVSRATSHQYQ